MKVPVYRIKCEGCRKFFNWHPRSHPNESPPSYHSKACKNRKRTRLHKSKNFYCPTKWKVLYRTHADAQRACNRMNDPYMKPYRCHCGGIHIGHPAFRVVDWMEL